MDTQTLTTIQALATLINSVGLPATIGAIALILTWNLAPALARWIESTIELNHAHALRTMSNGNGHAPTIDK